MRVFRPSLQSQHCASPSTEVKGWKRGHGLWKRHSMARSCGWITASTPQESLVLGIPSTRFSRNFRLFQCFRILSFHHDVHLEFSSFSNCSDIPNFYTNLPTPPGQWSCWLVRYNRVDRIAWYSGFFVMLWSVSRFCVRLQHGFLFRLFATRRVGLEWSPDETAMVLDVCPGCTAIFLANDDTACLWARHESFMRKKKTSPRTGAVPSSLVGPARYGGRPDIHILEATDRLEGTTAPQTARRPSLIFSILDADGMFVFPRFL